MKRNLIAVILALTASAVYAEPTLQLQTDENALKSAPEATSYVAESRGAMEPVIHSFNP